MKILLLVDNVTSYNVDNLEDYPNILICDFDRSIEESSKIDIFQIEILSSQHLVKIFQELEPAPNDDLEAQIIQIPKIITTQHEAQEVIDLTEDLHLRQLTQDYLDDDESIKTEEALDDELIIELVKNLIVNDNRSDDQVDEEPKIIFAETKNSLLTFICQQFFQIDSFIKENDEVFFMIFLPEHIELLSNS
ncbi:10680_t:CDS:2 [Racocetra persica]|uniref:10680_t:CDS:1 n=1 Tax=Racocetra persica TaxID=160502 RepID=A0ACA9MWB8_9GLOM|nr:10680_t:CDS:2 [Racocetra persica]